MYLYDVVSLFTHVPLAEVIDICADTLYRDPDIMTPNLEETSFRSLLERVTSGAGFPTQNDSRHHPLRNI